MITLRSTSNNCLGVRLQAFRVMEVRSTDLNLCARGPTAENPNSQCNSHDKTPGYLRRRCALIALVVSPSEYRRGLVGVPPSFESSARM